jgi:single-strand DNA-binding protein
VSERSINEVRLIGRLGQDAESRFTPSGVNVLSFSLATSRRWKNKKTDEWQEETDWHKVIHWNGENVASFLTKGKKVYVAGRLQTRSYEDKEGVKKYITEIVTDGGSGLILLSFDENGGGERTVSAPRPSGRMNDDRPARPAQRTQDGTYTGPADDGLGITDDDVPF